MPSRQLLVVCVHAVDSGSSVCLALLGCLLFGGQLRLELAARTYTVLLMTVGRAHSGFLMRPLSQQETRQL